MKELEAAPPNQNKRPRRGTKVEEGTFGTIWLVEVQSSCEYGREFSLQAAMKKLDDRLNAPTDPAYLHPAYQAMLRLDQIPVSVKSLLILM